MGVLKLVLLGYLLAKAPPHELTKAITDQCTPTLQRQLVDEGLTYRELLAVVRNETAIELMQNTEMKISGIAISQVMRLPQMSLVACVGLQM